MSFLSCELAPPPLPSHIRVCTPPPPHLDPGGDTLAGGGGGGGSQFSRPARDSGTLNTLWFTIRIFRPLWYFFYFLQVQFCTYTNKTIDLVIFGFKVQHLIHKTYYLFSFNSPSIMFFFIIEHYIHFTYCRPAWPIRQILLEKLRKFSLWLYIMRICTKQTLTDSIFEMFFTKCYYLHVECTAHSQPSALFIILIKQKSIHKKTRKYL